MKQRSISEKEKLKEIWNNKKEITGWKFERVKRPEDKEPFLLLTLRTSQSISIILIHDTFAKFCVSLLCLIKCQRQILLPARIKSAIDNKVKIPSCHTKKSRKKQSEKEQGASVSSRFSDKIP